MQTAAVAAARPPVPSAWPLRCVNGSAMLGIERTSPRGCRIESPSPHRRSAPHTRAAVHDFLRRRTAQQNPQIHSGNAARPLVVVSCREHLAQRADIIPSQTKFKTKRQILDFLSTKTYVASSNHVHPSAQDPGLFRRRGPNKPALRQPRASIPEQDGSYAVFNAANAYVACEASGSLSRSASAAANRGKIGANPAPRTCCPD